MNKKKKIAILTLRVDNNYGGHLQRYALSKVLQNLGQEPIVLFLRSTWVRDAWLKRLKKAMKNAVKALLGRKHDSILYWRHEETNWEKIRAHVFPFFEQYVRHSSLIYSEVSLQKHIQESGYETFVVGSDQVWRKTYTERWGVEHFFLDFAAKGTKKIAYAVSFGLPDMEYDKNEIKQLHELYKQLDAVSVREESGLKVLEKHGWIEPQAELVLDPTMLLPKEHYLELIKNGNTVPSKGNMFCYVLDENEDLRAKIEEMATEKQLLPFYASIAGEHRMSVEQWLRSFDDAEYVVTNSYHGVVFALIFNKPFYLIPNQQRGNARFESLMKMFGIQEDNSVVNWDSVNSKIEDMKKISMDFLCNNLKNYVQ